MRFNDKEYGLIRIIRKQDPLFRKVQKSLEKYNATHPHAQIGMPALIATRDALQHGALYNPNKDLLLFESKSLSLLDDEEFNAIAVHELRHKAQLHAGVPNTGNRGISPDRDRQANFMQANPMSRHVAELEPTAIYAATAIYHAQRQKAELDADKAAAETVSPEAILKGLLKIESSFVKAHDGSEPTDLSTHPSTFTRAAALGCRLVPDRIAIGQKPSFTVRCQERKNAAQNGVTGLGS